mmetsp:Transcript_20842/g.34381  ORF Transcript_20842/g.34381 Transcript_20842/m.34381 type:complete len:196 (-) Transcript_20842:335-922(-)
MFAAYQRAMARKPLLTNLCTAVPLMAFGDVAAQRIEGSTTADVQRTTTMVSYSGLVFTPLFFQIYRLQERLLHGSPLLLAWQKAIFSVVVGGIPANGIFLSLSTVIEMKLFGKQPTGEHAGRSMIEVLCNKLRYDWPRIVQGSIVYWVPMNFVNFYFVPVQYRLVISSFAAVGWNCFLSLVQHEYVSTSKAAPQR